MLHLLLFAFLHLSTRQFDTVRTLAKPQRQKWVSLLVKALRACGVAEACPEPMREQKK